MWYCGGVSGSRLQIRSPTRRKGSWRALFAGVSHLEKTCISSPNFRRDRHALHFPKWKAHIFTSVPECRLYESVPFIVLFVRTTLVVCIRTGWCCSLSMLASLVPFSSCCMLTRFANPGTFVPECISVAASMLPAGMFASHDQMHVNESISSAVCLLDHPNHSCVRRFLQVRV